MSKLTDVVYGIAYQNHRYDEDDYLIEFYLDWRSFRGAIQQKKAVAPVCKIIEFYFKPIDLIKKKEVKDERTGNSS